MEAPVGDPQLSATPTPIQAAADELGELLKQLADRLATRHTPEGVRYGPGRLGKSFRRRSPEGFALDPVNLQLLLPDGRLWSYSRSDSQRFPDGRCFDARADHTGFGGGRSYPLGTEFIFLGAVIGKYTFGYADGAAESSPSGLCALVSEGRAVRYMDAERALADLAQSFDQRHSPASST
ncbi:MAG: hypothetical protein FGM52_06000 [Mycobacterium sp.]|nr:hypothetical protein [Mycobacterium sp.]